MCSWALALLVIAFVVLGYLGILPPSPGRTVVAQLCTIVYFLFFIALFIISKNEKTKPVPERVTH